ncbi:endolytic transglycosylase MltG [Meridianimarinicoccus roseus]|uniref:Endolytic murein transglycosylase n=1 Tax=Meridianimarinicoccus roseus TaxID=2072018 RepID=A0A2V2LIT1_9RHOB|nr:endolytic transglycosylase MltG [Meridianimarinicoccus roseus]PWR03057.1 endolytic transglycosylase MltG [Meridianimarinicoccus roseus]
MLVWRSIASNALTLFIVLLIGAAMAVTMAQNMWRAPGPLAEALCLSVPRGATMQSVSDELAERGAVDRPALLRVGADYTDKADQLKAGNFLIPPRSSMESIVDLVTRGGASTCGSDINLRIGVADADIRVRELDPGTGEFADVLEVALGADLPAELSRLIEQGFARTRVTVAEGVTSWQIADSLRKAPFLSGSIDGVPDEGWLAPGSYDVPIGSDRARLLTRMREAQERILAEAWRARMDGLPLADAYEALILASIIEKETAVAEERPWVSSVFVNRLNQGMRLQTDPTVIYGLTNGEGVLGRGLRRSELTRATPYNTYVIPALPPTPIANPGRAAIQAALNPAETDFLFFVADGTGGHVFAETLAEHNINVQRWRRIEQQNQ